MRTHSLSHLSDRDLLRTLATLVAHECTTTAAILAHVAEADARRLYLPAGYPSMFLYCVHELHFSEEAAFKRIHAARTARQFPTLFTAVAEGRLHLSAVVMLAPHLTPQNADELVAAVTRKTKSEIEQLLALRFPRPDLPGTVEAVAARSDGQPVPGPVGAHLPELVRDLSNQHAPGRVEALPARPNLSPIAPGRYLLQVTLAQSTHEKLRYAQALLSHQIPSGDVAQVLDRALDALLEKLEKRKFGATPRPQRHSRRSGASSRHIPARVKRAVWQRDQGQCTFVGETGHRCGSRKFLEWDHVTPVARGGQATVDGVQLRCRAHNQFEAERTFGAGFMNEKREGARRAAAEAGARRAAAAESLVRGAEAAARAQAEARARIAEAQARSRAIAQKHARDVRAGLRELGVRAGAARRAVEHCETLGDVTLEERMRAALKFLCPNTRIPGRNGTSAGVST